MDTHSRRRDLKKLYKPPPEQDYSQNFKRLVVVIVISFVFIGGEVAAGILSHSIAIISDAIHLISDTVGFIFSFVFLYLSRWPSDKKMSFGHHRMELLGAISNIFIIWILIFFVVYESTHRIIDKQFVKQPMIMLITAVLGIIVNIVMYKILHNADNHSHGLLAEKCSHGHGHQGHQHGVEQRDEGGNDIQCLEGVCQDDDCNAMIKEVHCHKNKSVHKHGRNQRQLQASLQIILQPGREHQHGSACSLQHGHRGKSQLNREHEHKAEHQHKDGQQHKEKHQRKLEKREVCGGHGHQHDHQNHQHGQHGHQHRQHGCQHGQHGHEHQHNEASRPDEEEGRTKSLGMQAAVLHALSDMIMSVGLIISSLIIFLLGNPGKPYNAHCTQWNPWHLFDPISTYIFAVIAFSSTLPVVRSAYLLLMQSTPSYIDVQKLKSACEQINGVVDVHDLHVWDLKPGKTCMIAHVLARKGSERDVLVRLSDVARRNRIYHTTFQVEEQDYKMEDDYILCDHDIH